MPYLLFTYANHRGDQFLPQLGQEDEVNTRLLHDGVSNQHYTLHNISFTTRDQLAYWLRLLRDELEWFHYSGHAGVDELFLEDETARAEGLLKLLKLCPKLKGVVLNGCCTLTQARALVNSGIPLVIGTSIRVGDISGRIFSNAFYEELARGASVDQAHDAAIAELNLNQAVPTIVRSFGGPEEEEEENQAVWCLLGEEASRAYKFPQIPEQIPNTNFKPNNLLVEAMFNSLAAYAPEVKALQDLKKQKRTVSFARQRMAIVNSLPAPIAEQLRKLLVPVIEENQGYNQIGKARLFQMIATFDTAMEILIFTLLAQIWEVFLNNKRLKLPSQKLPSHLQKEIARYLTLEEEERATYPYLYFIRQLRFWLIEKEIPFFVEELAQLADHFAEDDSDFTTACARLESLRAQLLHRYDMPLAAMPHWCKEGEEALATVCGELGFLARYTLATVKNIDIQKYRHQQQAVFKHTLVRLIDLLGDLEESYPRMPTFLDNRSVLLIKEYEEVEEGKPPAFINLSPFVLDQNAFIEHDEVSQVHFLRKYAPKKERLYYRYVFKPTDALWELGTQEIEPLDAIYKQFAAFMQLVHPLNDAAV